MSEEVLRALMQLFAIIAKQDDGMNQHKEKYVRTFLEEQISLDQVEEYMNLFYKFAEDKKKKRDDDGEVEKKKKLTSVKDSVRTLGICKRINKTLTQTQRVVVIIRLFELVNSDRNFSEQRMAIIDAASKVFKIDKEEHAAIEKFVVSDSPEAFDVERTLLVASQSRLSGFGGKKIQSDLGEDFIVFLRLPSVNLYFLRVIGDTLMQLNGITLNNQRIYSFPSGSTLRPAVGTSFYYSDVASRFLDSSNKVKISYEARNITYEFKNGKLGLRGIDVAEEEGSLVAIMGASGAGKTTLLNVLNGSEVPTTGEVLINGQDIHRSKSQRVIGFVPQDDLLIEELTVYENLYYNARLCFKKKSRKELHRLVMTVLDNLGLKEIKHLQVGSPLQKVISGGQRKRLNIGLELIREPAVLFLDEPTSGLSSRDSENVMDLLRELSLKGHLVFVVIHQPSSEIYKMFDHLILLDVGGYQIYYGSPVEAVQWFREKDHQLLNYKGECPTCGNVNPESLFNIVEAKVVDEFGNLMDKRKVTPQQWNELFNEEVEIPKVETVDKKLSNSINLPNKLKQFGIFTLRDVKSKLSNTQYLLINLVEAPLLAFILSFIIRYSRGGGDDSDYTYYYNDNIPAFIFVSVVVALFLGLMLSAEEIFKDRKILKRERFLKLSWLSYLFSKVCVLFVFAALQMALFVGIGNWILEVEGMYFGSWVMLFSIAAMAIMLGLNISSAFNSAVTIYIVIPLLIIPQMILGGAMFSYEKLNESIGGGQSDKVPLIAELMPSRWAYEGMMVDFYKNNEYETQFYDLRKVQSASNARLAYIFPEVKRLAKEARLFAGGKEEEHRDKAAENLNIIRNTLEYENSKVPQVELSELDRISIENYSKSLHEKIIEWTDRLADYHQFVFNESSDKIDKITLELDRKDKSLFLRASNEYLAEIVRKSYTKEPTTVRDGRVVQQIDPIYMDPEPESVFDFRAQMFASQKEMFGYQISTEVFNTIVLWFFSLLLFISLYLRMPERIMKLF